MVIDRDNTFKISLVRTVSSLCLPVVESPVFTRSHDDSPDAPNLLPLSLLGSLAPGCKSLLRVIFTIILITPHRFYGNRILAKMVLNTIVPPYVS